MKMYFHPIETSFLKEPLHDIGTEQPDIRQGILGYFFQHGQWEGFHPRSCGRRLVKGDETALLSEHARDFGQVGGNVRQVMQERVAIDQLERFRVVWKR